MSAFFLLFIIGGVFGVLRHRNDSVTWMLLNATAAAIGLYIGCRLFLGLNHPNAGMASFGIFLGMAIGHAWANRRKAT